VEFSTALAFLGVWWRVVDSFALQALPLATWITVVLTAVLWATLLVITVYDFRTTFIPDRFNALFAVFALILLVLPGFVTTPVVLPEFVTLLAGPLLFLPFYVLWKVSNGRWIGLGDGKLAVGMGWFLGLEPGLSAVVFAFWIGALMALLVIATQHIQRHRDLAHKPLGLKSEIPFGPFLVAGTAVVYFTGITFTTLFL
jgi:leader peptidase (prepilin peptidase)/N-methyltransferase